MEFHFNNIVWTSSFWTFPIHLSPNHSTTPSSSPHLVFHYAAKIFRRGQGKKNILWEMFWNGFKKKKSITFSNLLRTIHFKGWQYFAPNGQQLMQLHIKANSIYINHLLPGTNSLQEMKINTLQKLISVARIFR